jgi:hypothetical protein
MIFDGLAVYDSKHQWKLTCREVYATVPATLAFLQWSRSAITFDRSDHPDSIPNLGRYPLIVDPIVDKKRLSKVLMDKGSGLNIIYIETLDATGINRSCIRLIGAPFYGIVLGKQAKPLG